MAPRDVPRVSPKVQRLQRSAAKSIAKGRSSPSTTIKKAVSTTAKIPPKMNNTLQQRQRTSTVPSTPKPKENKSAPMPGSVTKSAKKPAWKNRPKPAHSGVPVPEKMKQLLQKHFQDLDNSL